MNGSELKYTSEYVEIQTSLEHIRTKLEGIEQSVRNVQLTYLELLKKVDNNQIDLAGIKATAAIAGGAAGSLIALLFRLFLTGNH